MEVIHRQLKFPPPVKIVTDVIFWQEKRVGKWVIFFQSCCSSVTMLDRLHSSVGNDDINLSQSCVPHSDDFTGWLRQKKYVNICRKQTNWKCISQQVARMQPAASTCCVIFCLLLSYTNVRFEPKWTFWKCPPIKQMKIPAFIHVVLEWNWLGL